MKTKLQSLLIAVACFTGVHQLAAQGTAFTYQGRLNDGANPANGTYDFRFRLDADPAGNTILATALTNAIPVNNGLFTTTIDFGPGFYNGSNYWLEVDVKTNNFATYTALNPFQPLTPTPYAIFANTASNVSGTLSSAQISGSYNNAVSFTNGGNNFAGTFTGNGAGLTNLPANSNIALLNANQTFSGTNTFTGAVNLPGLSLQQISTYGSFNVIGGSPVNYVSNGITGAVIGGGGALNFSGNNFTSINFTNSVTDNFGTVGGGAQNSSSDFAIVGGGFGNSASGDYAFVGGGYENESSGRYTVVGGGIYNLANNTDSTVGGGFFSIASGEYSTIAGGYENRASGYGTTIAGGGYNSANANNSTVGGGEANSAAGQDSTVSGGTTNTASGNYSSVSGGSINTANTLYASVSGGNANLASGQYSIVAGGHANTASGDFSFAGGNHANAPYQGDFVWADDNGGNFAATANNQFYVRAGGGVFFYSGSGSWSSLSDRNAKENFQPVDAQTVLTAVAAMPMTTWNYKTQAKTIRHVGPMAQDFAAAFHVGENNTTISTVDEGGVALAAIQGLNEKLKVQLNKKDAEIEELKSRLEKLEQLMNIKTEETK